MPEDLLRQDFWAFKEHTATARLTSVIDDHKEVYQLTAFFTAKRGKALQVYARVPLKLGQNHAQEPLHSQQRATGPDPLGQINPGDWPSLNPVYRT